MAIRKVINRLLRGQKRVLLTMATGTGKTFVAFQIVWKLVKSLWLQRRHPERPGRVLFLADRAYYIRVLRSSGGFHDGTGMRNFIAYFGDGAGMSCAFSDDGVTWDNEKKLTGVASNGYHVVCVLESSNRLRILYWDPDVSNQPYAMAGLRTAVSNPREDPSAFTDDVACTGDLVTEGSKQVWNRGHYGPSVLWYNPEPTSAPGKPFTWRYAMLFIASTGGNDSLGLGYSDDALDWWLYGDGPVLSAWSIHNPGKEATVLLTRLNLFKRESESSRPDRRATATLLKPAPNSPWETLCGTTHFEHISAL